jgi:hypothetical protein
MLAFPVVLSGCATMNAPWSEVLGERYHVAIADRRPVNNVTVGGTGGWANNQPMLVDPGSYRVVVESRPHAGYRGGRQREMQLTLEPCMRYYLNAQFDNQVSADYTPVVDYVEPIGGCRRSA